MKILIIKNKKIHRSDVESEINNIVDILDKNNMSHVECDITEVDDIKKDDDISFVVAIGGDGTIIKGAKVAFDLNIPICGINAGHLGFLTSIDLNKDFNDNLNRIINGEYKLDRRCLIDVEVLKEDGTQVLNNVAINEVECVSSDLSSVAEFKLYIENKNNLLYDGQSCGILISTPTGSTGFSFSAGGPIVVPDVECHIIQPIYPHTFNQRPFVVNSKSDLIMVICGYNQLLFIDGQKLLKLERNDIIKMKKSSRTVDFIKMSDEIFYNNLKKKIRST